MSTALYVGIALSEDKLSVALLDEADSKLSRQAMRQAMIFPATAFGVQSLQNFLMAYMENLHMAVAISGHKALDIALKLGAMMSTQVFIIAASFVHEPHQLAEYARHVA